MKALLFILLATVSPLAFGETASAADLPVPSEGHYSFHGDFTVGVKLQYRVVYGFTDAGAAELEKRRAAGEECSNTGREIYLCKSFGKTDGAVDLLRGRVSRELDGKTLALGKVRGTPGIVHQGTDVVEYQVPQEARFAGKTYDAYRLVNAQGNWSVRLGEPVETQFNLSNGQLALTFDEAVTSSREAYDVYTVFASYQ